MKIQQKRIEETLELIRTQGYTISPDEFLQKIAKFLVNLFEVEYVLINKYSIKEPEITKTVIVQSKKETLPNFSYELANTPCENVINKDICAYPNNIQALFPKDELLVQMNIESYVGMPLWSSKGEPIGLIALLGSNPITETENIKTIINIAALKVEKILEKILFNTILNKKIKHLEFLNYKNKEIEEKFSKAFFDNPIAMEIVDTKTGERIEANESYLQIFEYSREEFYQGNVFTNKLIIDTKVIDINNKKLKTKGYFKESDFSIVSKSGKIKNLVVSGTMLNIDDGNKAILIFKDVTKQKEDAISIIKSQDQFKKLANLTFEGILIHTNSIVIDVNQTFEKMFGYKKEELVDKDIISIIFPKKYHNYIHEKRTQKYVLPYEIEGVKKDGTIFPLEIEARNIDGDTTKEIRVAAFRDLTERYKTQEQTKKLTTAVEQSANTIIITDVHGAIEYVNPKFTELTGYSYNEAIGKNPSILNSGSQPKEYYALMWKTITAGNTWYGEFKNKSKCGNIFWEQVTITPVKNEEGKTINYLGVKEDITKRKDAEIKLTTAVETIKQKEDYLRNIFNTTNEGFWIINTKAETLELNTEMCKILGCTENNVIGSSIFDFVDAKNTKIFNEQLKKRASGESSTYQIELINRAGKKTPCLFKTSPIYNSNNVRIGSFAMVTDISELKNAHELTENQNQELRKLSIELSDKNELLLESTNRFKNLFELSPVSIWEQDYSETKKILDKKKAKVKNLKKYLDNNHDFVIECIYSIKIVNVNKSTLDLLGVSNKDELLTHLRKSLNTYSIESLKKELLVIASDDEKELKEITKFIRTDGTEIITILRLIKVNNKGKVIVTLNDITSLKKIEQELITAKEEAEKNEMYFRTIYDSHMEPITITRLSDGKYADINEGFTNILGYTPEEIIGKTSKELNLWVNYNDREFVANELKKHGAVPYFETKIRVKNGKILTSVMSLKVFNYKNEAHILTVAHNVTQLKEAEQELIIKNRELLTAKEEAEESDRLKTEFLNNMSHEIRTPMNGILGFSEMLSAPDLDPIKRNNFVNIIQSSGNQLLHIIDDILDISSLGTKQVKVINDEVCLNDVLLELFSVFDVRAKENKTPLYLKKELSDKQSIFITDKTKLKKILSNLLDNALKFTNNGSIEFGYYIINEADQNKVKIYVKDSGIGIKPEKHELIFKRFEQAEKELSKKVGGLGLGLSIAKENTELLGGKIAVKSEMMNGSTFFVTLPFNPIYIDTEEENTTKHTILIAEDEEVNYMYLETILVDVLKLNCTIIHVKNGREAIDFCKTNTNIDLILMDLKMPTLNGFKATHQIRKFLPEVPIIAQTAYSTIEDKEKAIDAGCNYFISKPIDKDVLFDIIEKILIKETH